ncbi:hypothetical protein [Nonomuraea endophytica]|uniref:Uncharacterized protein n=1 Tax=Nonomuraea endophytica TaxID=714136 RepID=A0A7W8EGK4_9ACTN|nr:hypothetical protein [Nonomuraea endophytica]MBB5077637.1 hypothetical protein [Nonomuraea endophytica]
MTDDEAPPTPAEMLRLIEEQQTAAMRRFIPDPLLMYVPWGVAWFVGFGTLFLGQGLAGDGNGLLPITWQVGLAVLWATQIIAFVFMIIALLRAGGHIKGESEARGAMYGLAWFIGFNAMGILATRFVPLLPQDTIGPFYTSLFMLVAGLLYMAGGAVYRLWPQFLLGVWVVVVDVVGTVLGGGWIYLLLAVLGGGGAVTTGLWLRRHR